MKIKKCISVLLSLVTIMSIGACGKENASSRSDGKTKSEPSPVEESSTTKEESVDVTDTSATIASSSAIEVPEYDVSDPDSVVAYLEKELGATKTTIETMASKKETMESKKENAQYWSSGFYIDENVYPSLSAFMAYEINGQDVRGCMADRSVFRYCCSYNVLRHCFLNEFENGKKVADKNYETNRILCYCKYSIEQNKDLETFYDEVTKRDVSTEDDRELTTFIGYISFVHSDDAMEYFEDCVDRYANYYADKYVEKYEESKAYSEDLARNPIAFTNACKDPNAQILSRKYYYTNDLPENVYSLDKDKHEGHFSFSTDDKDATVYDYLYTSYISQPPYITVSEIGTKYSLILKDNVVVVVISNEQYYLGNTRDIFYDDWPEYPFAENASLVSFCNTFGIVNPYDIEMEEDLKKQFAYTESSRMVFQELFLRKEE